MSPLLANGETWNFEDAFALVGRELIGRLPGDPLKGPLEAGKTLQQMEDEER